MWKPTDCLTSEPVEKAKDMGFLLQILEGWFMSLMSRHFPSEKSLFGYSIKCFLKACLKLTEQKNMQESFCL